MHDASDAKRQSGICATDICNKMDILAQAPLPSFVRGDHTSAFISLSEESDFPTICKVACGYKKSHATAFPLLELHGGDLPIFWIERSVGGIWW